MRRPGFLLLSLLVLTACGVKRVPTGMLEKLPYESRIELLEAENALAVAIDRVDESRSALQRLRQAMKRADSLIHAAERELDDAGDPQLKEVAKLSVEEAESRRAFLKEKRRWQARELDVESLALDCAARRFEEARLKIVRELKVEGSESLNPEAFRAQTQACEEDEKEARAELVEAEAPVKEAQAKWDEQRKVLAGRTFEAKASVYVE